MSFARNIVFFCFFFLCAFIGNVCAAEFDITQELTGLTQGKKMYPGTRRYTHQEMTNELEGFWNATFPSANEIGIAVAPRTRKVHKAMYQITDVSGVFSANGQLDPQTNDAWRNYLKNYGTLYLDSTDKSGTANTWIVFSVVPQRVDLLPLFFAAYYQDYPQE